MEKKQYETPSIEVIELEKQLQLLSTSPGKQSAPPQFMDDGEFN